MGPAATDGEYYNNYSFMLNLIGYEDEQAMQALIVNYINQLRAQRGLKALLHDNRIDNYSHVRAEEISQYWSHTRPNGQHGHEAVPGYKYAGENLAYIQYDYQPSNEEVVTSLLAAWIGSPSHYSNNLWSDANYISVYVYSYVNEYGYIEYYACNLFMV